MQTKEMEAKSENVGSQFNSEMDEIIEMELLSLTACYYLLP
jgi:hypothetical protein